VRLAQAVTTPLLQLIDALGRDEIDLVAFTSASQASNLFTVAQYDGKEASLKQNLGRTLVASIGPVCSAALRKLTVRVDIEAQPPKLGREASTMMPLCIMSTAIQPSMT
jgi:uroporphyrinogen-III synthase